DIRGDLMRSRHRLSKLLLRHDVRYDDTASAWTAAHRAWLSKVELGERAAQATLLDYLGAIDALVSRRDTIERLIDELVPHSPWAEPVARLRCLRGIDTLSAVGLCAEIGDFRRFDHPAKLMSYLGLVPSENSSGQTRRQGAITKSGSRHARRLLVEAAWHYRRPPRNGTTLQRRQQGQPAQLLAISWKAQQRLHQLWRRLDGERGKRKTIVACCRRPPPRRLLLGDHHHRPEHLTEHDSTARLRKRQNTPGHAREHPRSNYEKPPRRQRSILERGLSRRNPVLRYPTRAYQSDRASRIRRACRSLSRAPTPPPNCPPYQLLVASRGYSEPGCSSSFSRMRSAFLISTGRATQASQNRAITEGRAAIRTPGADVARPALDVRARAERRKRRSRPSSSESTGSPGLLVSTCSACNECCR